MSESNTASFVDRFPGQQDGERVLHVIRPHKISESVELAKIVLFAVVLFVILAILSVSLPPAFFIAITLPPLIIFVGWWVIHGIHEKTIAYITDRRVVRFQATTPFHASIRTINYDDVTKVKTLGGGFFEDMVGVGTLVFSARTSMVKSAVGSSNNLVDDDLEIRHVYFHKDLANYLDKILYLFKHDLQELKTVREFVAKPRGKRY